MKKILSLIALSILAGSSIFFTGCQSAHDTGGYVPINTMVNDLENHESVVLLDPRVQYSVTCPGIQQTASSDCRMQVIGQFRNRENRRIQVQINCEFKDDQGYPTEGDYTPFQTLILDENAQQSVTFMSMNNKAKRFTIRVREAH